MVVSGEPLFCRPHKDSRRMNLDMTLRKSYLLDSPTINLNDLPECLLSKCSHMGDWNVNIWIWGDAIPSRAGMPPGNLGKIQRPRFLLTSRSPGHHTGVDCMELSPESDIGGGCPRSLPLWHFRPVTASLPPAEQSPGEGGHRRLHEPGAGSCQPGGRMAECSTRIAN